MTSVSGNKERSVRNRKHTVRGSFYVILLFLRHALMNINEACRWMREAADGSEERLNQEQSRMICNFEQSETGNSETGGREPVDSETGDCSVISFKAFNSIMGTKTPH